MLMTMFIVLALYTFYKIYTGTSTKSRYLVISCLCIFRAVFKRTCGFTDAACINAGFLIFKKANQNLEKILGAKTLIILLVLCGISFAGVLTEGGTEYLNNLVFHQTVGRAVDSFHHQLRFFYGISIWYSIFPWSFYYRAFISRTLL